MSFDVILPFLRPIEHLMRDPGVSEIMVNAGSRVFVEREGQVSEAPGISIPDRSLQVAVRNIARALGDEISEEKPILDSRLPDGSRVAAVLPPCSVNGITLTIRKFDGRFFTIGELVRVGTMTPPLAGMLRQAVGENRNILICGGTGSGKTTILNALSSFIPSTDRMIVIEETSEIRIAGRNVVRFEARREQSGMPAVTIRDLLRAALRHRPDRIIVGEVRGEEAFDLLQALNTGHSGALSTIHANSAAQAVGRLAACALQSGIELPFAALRASIAESIHLLLHMTKSHGRRTVGELVEVKGYDHERGEYRLERLFPRTEIEENNRGEATG